MTTFARVLESERERDGGRPLVTFYDETSGERVELSVTTYANWVAKTASLLVDEHGLERGETLAVDLPAHWLTTVFFGAAWSAGLIVTQSGEDEADLAAVVTGPAGLTRWAERAEDVLVLACSLLPMGVRFADPLPPEVHDVGVEVWSQPDAFIALDPPSENDAAVHDGEGPLSQGDLWKSAAAGNEFADGGRLLIAVNTASPLLLSAFTEPLARGGSVVLVVGGSPDRVEKIATAERVTHTW